MALDRAAELAEGAFTVKESVSGVVEMSSPVESISLRDFWHCA